MNPAEKRHREECQCGRTAAACWEAVKAIALEHAARGCTRRHAAESCECGGPEFPARRAQS